MKRGLLITFVMVCFWQGSIAQDNAKIDVTLQQEMSLRNASELVGINIILNQQYDQMSMRLKSSVLSKKEDKRTFVVSELKRFSGETQRDVMNYLKLFSEKGQVSNIQSHWIYNGIYCYATKTVIKELATFDEILIIGFDKQYKLAPDDKKADITDASKEITYNVLKVKANEVWNLGYAGEGVIVAIADCGVNYNHYDLRDRMWTHPDFQHHGWDFVFNNNDPMDLEGHGTHCAGTIVGDGTAGSQTGIAPKATIMALKVWDDRPGVNLGSANTMSSGFAFAVEYGAHVISMSGGVFQPWVTDADKILLRSTMVNVLESGIIAAVAAGNEGDVLSWYPVPQNVRIPGSCPPPWLHPDQTTTGGLSAVVCVGSTDIDDNIAGSSSIGPSTWQSISGYNDYPYNSGMGLIRPDVCAPGVNIKSCSHTNNSGYTSMSGTSMATPCVAGVMALMLSKKPELTPAEICEILETTAVHLPNQSSPKGNIFGSGRIDAYAAVQAVPVCLSINFINQTVTADTTVTSCGNINVQNVKVQNGAKLILDAGGEVNIISDFEVESGSEFEIVYP